MEPEVVLLTITPNIGVDTPNLEGFVLPYL